MTKQAIQILLIEDNELDTLLLKEILSQDTVNAFEFTISGRLDTGLEILHMQRFDAILLDLGLPDSQGLETFLRVHKEFPDIPVVVLSGLMDERIALEAVQSGAQDYLVKGPTSWEMAARAVRYAVERQQAQAALRESEEKFRTLIEQSSEGIVLVGEDGNILEWNQAMERITGISQVQAAHLPVWDIQLQLIPSERRSPQMADSTKALFSKALQTGNLPGLGNRLEVEIQTTRGERKTVTQTIFTIRTPHGYRIGSIVLDITERKRAEEALQKSLGYLEEAEKIAHIGHYKIDMITGEAVWSKEVFRIFGLYPSQKEPTVEEYRQLIHAEDVGAVYEMFEISARQGSTFDLVYRIRRGDGEYRYVHSKAETLKDAEERVIEIFGTLQDISERTHAEQSLRQRLVQLETLYESGLSLNQLLEPKEIGQKIIDVLAEKLDWYHTTIRLYHPESNRLELLAYNLAQKTTQEELQVMGARFKNLIAQPGDGLSGWALQHGETVRCSDVTRDPRYLETVPGVRSGLYVPIKIGERTIGVISVESKEPDYFTAEDEHMAVTLAAQAAIALENIRLFKDLQKSNDDLFRAYDETIEGWSNALDLRDKETEGHTQRVTTLTVELARAMGISEANMIHIRRGALLHDIGKMSVPDHILLKPGKLTDKEWEIMRQHPVHAYNLLARIDFLRPALDIPRYHHERWDGSGYPDRLKGEQIPLMARIFAIVDVWDALTSDRPYRKAWTKKKALNYICKQSGKYFDPQILEKFLKLIG